MSISGSIIIPFVYFRGLLIVDSSRCPLYLVSYVNWDQYTQPGGIRAPCPRRRGGRASGAQGQRHIHTEDQQARHQLRPGILPVQDTAGHRAGLQVIRRHAGRHGQLHARPVFVRGMAVHQPSCASDALCRHRHACREGPDRQILLRGCHGLPEACPGKPHRRRVATDKNH